MKSRARTCWLLAGAILVVGAGVVLWFRLTLEKLGGEISEEYEVSCTSGEVEQGRGGVVARVERFTD